MQQLRVGVNDSKRPKHAHPQKVLEPHHSAESLPRHLSSSSPGNSKILLSSRRAEAEAEAAAAAAGAHEQRPAQGKDPVTLLALGPDVDSARVQASAGVAF